MAKQEKTEAVNFKSKLKLLPDDVLAEIHKDASLAKPLPATEIHKKLVARLHGGALPIPSLKATKAYIKAWLTHSA